MRNPVNAVRTPNGWTTEIEYRIDVEPSPRWVRGRLGGETIVDSTDVWILREQGLLPAYYFPRADVSMDLLTPTDHSTHCPHKGDASYWTIAAGGKTAENAVWSYRDPFPQMAAIKDLMAFYWNRMDHWYEEDEEVFVHARDPRKRIDVIDSSREVRVILGGAEIAKSTNARFLFETDLPTRYYLPQSDVRLDLLSPTNTRTRCPYKGEAVYWTAAVGDDIVEDIVWSYPKPIPECPRIKDLMCFYNEVVDAILVDGVEQPRPETKWSRDR